MKEASMNIVQAVHDAYSAKAISGADESCADGPLCSLSLRT
jgi:hypothetical protein